MNNRFSGGAVYFIVLIIITLLTIAATFLFNYFFSHRSERKARADYAVASQRAAASSDIAVSWLLAEQTPPENHLSENTVIRGETVTVATLVKQAKEADVAETDLYWYSFDDQENDAAFVILPIGAVPSPDCDFDYDPACAVEYSYLILSRGRYGETTLAEQKRIVTRTFFE